MKKPSLEIILATALGVGAFGPVLGFEATTQLQDPKIKITNTSFVSYLSTVRKVYGNNTSAYAFALWTYPGAIAGAAVHNSRVQNSYK